MRKLAGLTVVAALIGGAAVMLPNGQDAVVLEEPPVDRVDPAGPSPLLGLSKSKDVLRPAPVDSTATIEEDTATIWQQLSAVGAKDLIQLAMRHLTGQNARVAERMLETVLSSGMGDGATAYSIAELLASGGRDPAYLQWVAQALANHPENAQADSRVLPSIKDAYLTVTAAAARTDPNSALAFNDLVIAQFPNDPDVAAQRASALVQLGHKEQAINQMASIFEYHRGVERQMPAVADHALTDLSAQRYLELMEQVGDSDGAASIADWLAARKAPSLNGATQSSLASDVDAGG